MTKGAAKAFNIRNWPREGLILEHAIERAIRPLKTLYAAHTALQDLQRGRIHRDDYVLPDFQDAFERERQATIEPFRELLASEELVISVRPLYDVGAPHYRLHSDYARELDFLVVENSVQLRLGTRRLHALIWPRDAVPQPTGLPADSTEMPYAGTTAAKPAKAVGTDPDGKKVGLKRQLDDMIAKIPFPSLEKRAHGWKKEWAKAAASAINELHKKDPKQVKRTTRRSIENRMNDFGLWPE